MAFDLIKTRDKIQKLKGLVATSKPLIDIMVWQYWMDYLYELQPLENLTKRLDRYDIEKLNSIHKQIIEINLPEGKNYDNVIIYIGNREMRLKINHKVHSPNKFERIYYIMEVQSGIKLYDLQYTNSKIEQYLKSGVWQIR